jgi:hypothetical protein
MARLKNTWWQRKKYVINSLALILPCVFIYHALFPSFPSVWAEKDVGVFKVAPMPLNMKPPYSHHNEYVKDFYLAFGKGQISDIRQAYLNIGPKPIPIRQFEKGDEGIMHGTNHGQHAHAIAPATLLKSDKLWLTIETWQNDILLQSWDIPQALIVEN